MKDGSQTYAHRLTGDCRCGQRHDNRPPSPKRGSKRPSRRIVATYDYTDEDGTLLFQTVRYDPKDFAQRQPDGKGGWKWNLEGVRRVLYRLPELLGADPSEPVFIVEGEKDVDRLAGLGLVATTNPMGVKKWRPEYSRYFEGLRVVIIPDNDKDGAEHVPEVANDVHGVAENVRLLELAGLPEKGDVSDWLNMGGTVDKLMDLARKAPEWEPPPPVEGRRADVSKRKSQATLLVGLAEDAELWHTPEYDAFATIEVDEHKENYSIRSPGFKRWLARAFYGLTGAAPNAQALQDAFSVIGGKAVFEGQEHTVFTRLAGYDGKIYLDLANSTWEVVEVTDIGWRVIANPPVKFRRPKGMLSLPAPVAGGDIKSLRRFVNVVNVDDWALLLAFLVASLRPIGPYPVLVIHGEQGSAKSTLARVLRALIDPNTASLRAEPKEPRDLMIAATNSWCMALDNLSHLPPWLSDAICRLSTGGGFATRTLYENDGETIFDAQRPVIANGIEELAVRGDLLDRAIILYLPKIEEAERRPEDVFWSEFESVRPIVLGGLLDAVSLALRDVGQVRLDRLPRMADFAIWSVAAAPALGLSKEAFLDAYTGNRESANELTLESSAVVPPLRLLVAQKGIWEGTATGLLEELNERVDDKTQRQKGWPSNARALGNALRRLLPNLRAVGIDITFYREAQSGRRLIAIGKGTDSIVTPVTPVTPVSGEGDANADRVTQGDVNPAFIVTQNRVYSDDGDDGDAKPTTLSKDVIEVE